MVFDGTPETASWTCVLADPLFDADPGNTGNSTVDQLPATGQEVPTWMTPVALLLIMVGMGMVSVGRPRSARR